MTRIVFRAGAAALALALFACASAPPPAEPPAPQPAPAVTPPPQPAPQPAAQPAPAVPAPEKELAQARQSRERVVRFKLDQQAPQEFAAADARLKEGEAQMNKDNTAARTAIEAAAAGYRKILQDGLAPLARQGRQGAETVRSNAVGIKADVAMAAEFAAADAVYKKAVDAQGSGDHETAIGSYEESRGLFARVYEQTKVKKDRAERAVQEARLGLADAEARSKAAEDAQRAEGTR